MLEQLPNRIDISQNNEQMVENNIFEFDGILENIDPIMVEHLHVPNLDRNNQQITKDSKIGEKFRKFNQDLRAIFENFSDFKKLDKHMIFEYDLYFKLIAK